jgi:hypothetical protein
VAGWLLVTTSGSGCTQGTARVGSALSCKSDVDCSGGLTCQTDVCATPPPTAGAYQACALDVDCPAGDHCNLGACAHDCVADRDCADGKTCDARGRCQVTTVVNQPAVPTPPTPTSAVLQVDATALDFGSFEESKTITLNNIGDDDLDFRIIADQTWVAAEPVTGKVSPNSSATVSLSVRKAGAGTRATVSIVSTGGAASIPITVPSTITGLYQGQIHITDPEELGTRDLAIVFSQTAAGELAGVVDDVRSPVFGFRAPMDSATVTGDQVRLAFTIPARSGTPANPSYPRDLLRKVSVDATITGAGKLSGAYSEEIEGVLAPPVKIQGTIELGPVDRQAVILPPQHDTITVQPPPAPTFLGCETCPGGAPCPPDHVQAGRQFLTAALPFYQQALADGSGDAYAPIRACIDDPRGCYDPIALHCAQAHFYQAVQQGGSQSCTGTDSNDCAQRGLLDTFKGLLAWKTLNGNEHLVRAYELSRPLDVQTRELSTAAAAFQQGYLGSNTEGAKVHGFLDPFFMGWMAALPATSWVMGRGSLLPEELLSSGSPSASTVAPFGDFDHLVSALRLRMQALPALLTAQHRLAGTASDELVQAAGKELADAHLSLALAATLRTRMGRKDSLSPVVNAHEQLANKVQQIGSRLNPAGYPEGFIAYTYNPALGPTSNNYRELMKDFLGNWLPNASAAFGQVNATDREFESSIHAVTQQLATANTDSGKQITELCGGSGTAPSIADCGKTGGLVFDTTQELSSAYLRLQNAVGALRNAYTAIEIEQYRAAQLAQLHTVTAVEIAQDGTKLEALAKRETDIANAEAALNGFANMIGNIESNPAAVFGAAAGAAISIGFSGMKLKIEQEKIRLATTEKARVEYNAAKEVLIDSAARVRTQLLEIPNLNINIFLAQTDIARALGRLQSQLQQARDADSARRDMRLLSSQDPRRDPAFRAYRDEETHLAVTLFDQAMGQLFLVTRAYEYEVGMSYEDRGALWSLVSPDQMKAYTASIETAYQRFTAFVGSSQARNITLSLRDQIYHYSNGLKDEVTGHEYPPAELFRVLLAAPQNRDADGNLKLTFALSLAPDALIFNQSLCTAKITGVRVSLVGSSLGARQPEVYLQQRGSAFLRSCGERGDDGSYLVSEYNLENTIGLRRSVVQAGVNLSGPADMSSGTVNTEFYGRPLAATYELIIDRKAPANADLDLTKLDDIVLMVQHETRTVR